MVKKINTLLIIVIITSCGVPSYVRQNFTHCYNGMDTEIESLIDIHGYYVSLDSSYMTHSPHNPFVNNIMFFKDGMFLYNFWGSEPVGHPFMWSVNQKIIDIPQYFQKIIMDTIPAERYGFRESFSASFYWGIYKISGDTIVAQYINNPSPPKSWIAFEIYFKVMDRNTIVPIGHVPLAEKVFFEGNTNKMQQYSEEKQQRKTARFVYVDNIPNSYSWLKKEKWFRCNEEDWKGYMENLKKNEK